MDLPVVNHKDYVAKIGDDHKFPINKFSKLANYLIEKKIVKKFHNPYPCSEETLKRAHSEKYIKDIVYTKPNAVAYVDDKGIRFENWDDTLKQLER